MKIGDNYKVAIAFSILPFMLCKFFKNLNSEKVMLIFFGIAILCVVIPTIGCFIHDMLAKTGKFLGEQIARIILFFVWIFAVLPTGLVMKIVRRDRLNLKKSNVKSYWIDNKNTNEDYEYQF